MKKEVDWKVLLGILICFAVSLRRSLRKQKRSKDFNRNMWVIQHAKRSWFWMYHRNDYSCPIRMIFNAASDQLGWNDQLTCVGEHCHHLATWSPRTQCHCWHHLRRRLPRLHTHLHLTHTQIQKPKSHTLKSVKEIKESASLVTHTSTFYYNQKLGTLYSLLLFNIILFCFMSGK